MNKDFQIYLHKSTIPRALNLQRNKIKTANTSIQIIYLAVEA
jgi:hypothetical protein